MHRKIIWSVFISAGFALGACGTVDDGPGDGPSQMDNGNDDDQDTGADPTEGNESNGQTGGNDSNDDEGETDSADTGSMTSGVGFIENPDNGGVGFECDIFAQDCPEGQKCMPWSNDGTSAWNATRCSEIDDNPGQPGDDCTTEGGGTSGVDSCDLGGMCWNVDPETGVGNCVAMCTGDAENPICEDPSTACSITNDGALVLCLSTCDPLLQDCPNDNEACYPVVENFQCAPDASGEMGVYGDPCEYINVCDPGLACLVPEAVPGCIGSIGCCSEFCDISDPAGNDQCSGVMQGQECLTVFPEGNPIPGLEDVGYCQIPQQ